MKLKKWNRTSVSQFMVGSLMGTGAALLLAPQSGRKTRQEIRHFGKRAKNESRKLRTKLKRSIGNWVGRTSERLEGKIDRVFECSDIAVEKVHQALVKIRGKR